MRSKSNRAVAAVTAAALALTTVGVAPALAAPRATKGVEAAQSAGEFSSRRYSQARSNAAAAAVFGAIIAGVASYAAAREYRKAREREYQYRYGNGYGAPYGYYAPRPYRGGYYGW